MTVARIRGIVVVLLLLVFAGTTAGRLLPAVAAPTEHVDLSGCAAYSSQPSPAQYRYVVLKAVSGHPDEADALLCVRGVTMEPNDEGLGPGIWPDVMADPSEVTVSVVDTSPHTSDVSVQDAGSYTHVSVTWAHVGGSGAWAGGARLRISGKSDAAVEIFMTAVGKTTFTSTDNGSNYSTSLHVRPGTSGPACAKAPTLGFSAEPDAGFRSRGVSFTPSAPAGTKLTWNFGDGAASTLTRPYHTYRKTGEYRVTVYGIKGNCPQAKHTETVVSDPVTTYAPSVHLAKGEPVQPDSVTAFLDHALLVRDKPQQRKTDPNPDDRGCQDTVVAAGKSIRKSVEKAGTSVHKRAQRRAAVPKHVATIDQARLAGKHRTYSARQSIGHGRFSCKNGKGTTKSSSASGAKSEAKDDGFVLSLAVAPKSVLRGDASRAPFYVTYKKTSRLIEYWFFYPANLWEFPVTHHPTEKHEADWEHIVVRLKGANYTMDKAAYYQHYCGGESHNRGALDMSGTHPPVWSARGGHASYSKDVGVVKTGACPSEKPRGQGIGDHTISGGQRWSPWKNPTLLVNVTAQPWYGSWVAWGDAIPSKIANYGPRAPGANQYKLPSGW